MKYYFTILLTFYFIISSAQNEIVINKFAQSIGNGNASIGLCIKDMDGKEIGSYNKNNVLTPASILKIVTSATALEVLGDDYRFETVLSIDKNDPQHLIVHGYGDPTLGSEYLDDGQYSFLDTWVAEIKKNIDPQKPMTISIVDDYFGYSGVSPKWIQEDLGNYFAAGAYGISIFDNAYKLYFNTMEEGVCPEIVKTIPEMKDIIFFNTLIINSIEKDNAYINGEPFSNYRKLVGDIPAKKTSFYIKGDIPNPGLMLGNTLAQKLIESGFTVNSIQTSREFYYQQMFSKNKTTHYQEVPFHKHTSPTLKDIIRVVNERSNNHYTEHLMRAIGRAGNTDIYSDALTEGIMYTKLFWKMKGIDPDAMFIYDGCGLAPSNKISTALMCDILLYMQNTSKYNTAFVASLPRVGKEGTVKNLLKGTRLEGKLLLKSGSISEVQCFAGYYIDGDRKYVLSLMVNNYNSPRKDVVRAIENLLLDLF